MHIHYKNIKNHIIFILLALFLSLTLSSCSSILTLSTATFITTTWYDSRTIGTQLDDNILKILIYYSLNKNESITKSIRIKSTVYKGNVLLTGQSPSIYLSTEAVKIVKNIQGVKNVYNAIRKQQPIPLKNIIFDSLISNQIRLNLFTQKNTHLSNIKVITENEEVFLVGTVTREEGYYAENIAKNVKGVKKISTIFIYN